MERSSGILLHITSLPSKYGIGNLGKEAYAFVDFLKQAGQKYWQILPLCPPGYGDSPYQGFSTFAGNPYLIDPEELVEKGWLARKTLESVQWSQRDDQVDFRQMYDERLHMLQAAFSGFHENEPADFQAFVEQEAAWLPEYALFMAIKAHFNDRPWLEWPADIRLHQPQAIAQYRESLQIDVRFHCFLQYVFHKQWQNLRAYAHENGVQIIGDVPIYVPLDSADVWAHPENFQLGRTRRPRCVAGCPPDGFSKNGQYWGNPIYDWERMEQDGFPGGCSASARQDATMTSCASTISAASRAIGASLPSTRPRATGAGSKDPDSSWCARFRRRIRISRSLPRIWAS